jgi:putative phage-type endonuclease
MLVWREGLAAMRQTMDEWLAERRKGIGGSDAASILSEGYGCPRALFYDKSGVEPDFQHSPETMGLFERGHSLEPLIARRFTKETGLVVRNMPTRVSVDRPWMRVNVDRMIHSLDVGEFAGMGPGYLECKTANEHVFSNMQQEGMPSHYVIQVQHGLAVTSWQWGYFAVLEPYTFKFLAFPYKRNEKLVTVLLDAEEVFWCEVKAGNIPAKLADFNDSRCEKCQWRRSCRNAEALPKTVKKKAVYEPDTSEAADILAGNIKLLAAQVDDADTALQNEHAKMKELMGDRTAILVPRQGVKFSFNWQSGRHAWDTKALDAERPDLASVYKLRGEPFRQLRMLKMFDATEDESKMEALKERA